MSSNSSSSNGNGNGNAFITPPIITSNGANNPASALVTSARPPVPLAPRLTTASTSQQAHSAGIGLIASASQRAFATHFPTAGPSTAVRPRPRPLIHRASLSSATQALNIDTSPPSARFPAYLHHPARTQRNGSTVRRSTAGSPSATAAFRQKSKGSTAHGLVDSTLQVAGLSGHLDAYSFEVLPQFRSDADYPGDVLVRCSGTEFYVHRAILYFASPFFQAILDGGWKETHLSLHTLSEAGDDEGKMDTPAEGEPKIESGDGSSLAEEDMEGDEEAVSASVTMAASPRASFYTADFALDGKSESPTTGYCSPIAKSKGVTLIREEDESSGLESEQATALPAKTDMREDCSDPTETGDRLQRLATPPLSPSSEDETEGDSKEEKTLTSAIGRDNFTRSQAARGHKLRRRDIVAIIDLSEEEAGTFQDFLSLVYPNLDLLVTWYNIFPLFAFSDKFEVPHLRRACTTFLRAALAGRPIEAMALAERHGLEDVYREASRHVLENMPSWEPEELEILCSDTLLRLERKRTWFLERLLKLGLANPARDYECHASCPDPENCALLLHQRWRSQYANAFKYGPPQPSIIWRHLRELESSGPVTSVPVASACQSSSKAWVQLLFDRMYGLPTHGMTHPKFLSIKLDPDQGPRPRPRPLEGDMSLPS